MWGWVDFFLQITDGCSKASLITHIERGDQASQEQRQLLPVALLGAEELHQLTETHTAEKRIIKNAFDHMFKSSATSLQCCAGFAECQGGAVLNPGRDQQGLI